MVSVVCTCGLGMSQVVVEDGRSIEPVTLPDRDIPKELSRELEEVCSSVPLAGPEGPEVALPATWRRTPR
jgi:hypothetical protein